MDNIASLMQQFFVLSTRSRAVTKKFQPDSRFECVVIVPLDSHTMQASNSCLYSGIPLLLDILSQSAFRIDKRLLAPSPSFPLALYYATLLLLWIVLTSAAFPARSHSTRNQK